MENEHDIQLTRHSGACIQAVVVKRVVVKRAVNYPDKRGAISCFRLLEKHDGLTEARQLSRLDLEDISWTIAME